MKPSIRLLLAIIFCFAANVVGAATRYVDLTSTNSVAPFTNRTEAAISIQDAVDLAIAGDTILVADGAYASGGTTVNGLSNRVVVTKAVILRSENGPSTTSIVGVPRGTNAVRCVFLDNGAILDGFTLTNGGTFATGSASTTAGGGVYCPSGLLTNCVIINCSAQNAGGIVGGTARSCLLSGNDGGSGGGGGADSAVLYNCILKGNTAGYGAGASGCTLYDCVVKDNVAAGRAVLGGGISGGTATRCVIVGNWTDWDGGGAGGATLRDCLITSNIAYWYGGAARDCTLVNCTVSGNTAVSDLYDGCYRGSMINSIVWPDSSSGASTFWTNSCTPAAVVGEGNITEDPQFMDPVHGNYRLGATSPCLNQGSNAFVSAVADLDGFPRVVAGIVDMGAYEWQVPTQLAFVTPPGPGGAELTMSGETGRAYNLFASSNLVNWFWLANVTNTIGQVNYTDPLSPYPPARFYKAVPLP